MMRNAKKNAAAAALVGAMMLGGTASVNAQAFDATGPKETVASDRMQVRSTRQARAENRRWHAQNRGWNERQGWNAPLGWPGAAAAGAGLAAGAVIGGSVAVATGYPHYRGYPHYGYVPHGHVYGSQGYGAFAQEGMLVEQGGPWGPLSYDSGGAAIFANELGPYCTLGMKQQQRC